MFNLKDQQSTTSEINPKLEPEIPIDQESAAGIMRSVAVCLNILLEHKNILRTLLIQHEISSRSPDTASVSARDISRAPNITQKIVDHINEILLNDHFSKIREGFIKSLQDLGMSDKANFFIERLGMAQNLPVDTQRKIGTLMQYLIQGTSTFINWLWSFISNEHHTTQTNSMDLIFNHLSHLLEGKQDPESSIDNPASSSSATSCNDSCYAAPSSLVPPEDVLHSLYADLWGDFVYGQETPAQIEEINKRIQLIQYFKVGVKDQEGFVWKFKDLEKVFSLSETKEVLHFSASCPGKDFGEKLSFAVNKIEQHSTAGDKVYKLTI